MQNIHIFGTIIIKYNYKIESRKVFYLLQCYRKHCTLYIHIFSMLHIFPKNLQFIHNDIYMLFI